MYAELIAGYKSSTLWIKDRDGTERLHLKDLPPRMTRDNAKALLQPDWITGDWELKPETNSGEMRWVCFNVEYNEQT
ncbi:hypothetical protein [Saccharopolyspora griseoalba]|uniref:Uncharacterized protein n=1 Tax=Saccharopolyspora griseoalba TaxID=1431848 RepID=A0ABW2LQ06_9PSEU